MAVLRKTANGLTVDISSDNNYGLNDRIQMDSFGNDVLDLKQGNYWDFALYAIRYKKEIYKPGYVDIDMIFINDDSKDVSSIDGVKAYFIGNTTKLDVTDGKDNYVAKGYYFCSVNVQTKEVEYLNDGIKNKSSKVVVTARAYSPDYFLTLAKYNKSYVGKKLSDIIREKLSTKPSLSSLFPAEGQINLCHTTIGTSNDEIQQPYLVQYDESFHDFVVRVANRCGELFYYENGKLFLGVDGDTLDASKNFVAKNSLLVKPSNYNFFEVPAEFMDDVAEFSKSLIDKNGDAKSGSVGDDGLYRNAVIGSDDYLRRVSDKDNIGMNDLMEPHWLEILHNAFQADSIISAAAEGIKTSCMIPIQGAFTAKSLEMEGKDINKFNSVMSQTGKSDNEINKLLEEFKTRYSTLAQNENYFKKSEDVDMTADEKKTVWNTLSSIPYKAWKEYQRLADKVPGEYIDDFKRNYEILNTSLFVTKTNKEKDDVWKDTGSNPYKALTSEKQKHEEYLKGKKEEFKQTQQWKTEVEAHKDWTEEQMWTDDPVCKGYLDSLGTFNEFSFKMMYEVNHPEEFCTITPLTDDQKKTLWNDKNKDPYKALEEYKKNEGKKYVDIEDQKKKYRNGDGKDYFKSGITESEEREVWKDISIEKKNNKDNPYNWLYNQFTTEYEKSHSDLFKKKKYGEMMSEDEKKAVWNDADSVPHRDLMKYETLLKKNVDNLYNAFYTWMEKKEKMVTDTLLVNGSGNKVPKVKLGHCVEFANSSQTTSSSNKKYLVHGVECSISSFFVTDTEGKPQQKYNVNGSTTVFELLADTQRKQQYGYQTQMFPPLSDIPHVRKAEPQQAIISSISDPLRMGRVQIRYPWNNDAYIEKDNKRIYSNASPWIPMTTPFTGNDNGGFLMTPNTGDYVMVDYEDGNVERPFVSGSLYKDTTSWGSTPIVAGLNKWDAPHRAITTSGNGITFVDGKDEKFVSGLFPGVLGLILQGIPKLQEDKKLGGGLILSDWYGMYNISMSSATRSINIDSPWGSVNMSAFTGINIKCPNGDINIEGKNVNISAGNKITLQSGTNIKSGGMGEAATLAVAGGLSSLGLAALTSGLQIDDVSNPSLVSKITKFADCSFLRNVWEIAMRPVDGSLTINSKRNVILESGGGKANVPADTLSQISKPKNIGIGVSFSNVFKPTSDAQQEAKDKDEKKWSNTSWAFYHIANKYQEKCSEYLDKVEKLVNKCLKYEKIDFHRYSNHFNEKMTDEVLTQKAWNMEDLPSIEELFAHQHPGVVVNQQNEANVAVQAANPNDLQTEYNQVKKVFDDAKAVFTSLIEIADIQSQIKTKLESIEWGLKKDQLKAALIPNSQFTVITNQITDIQAVYMPGNDFNATLKNGSGNLNKDSLHKFNKEAYFKEYSRVFVIAIVNTALANRKIRKKGEADVRVDSISNILNTAEIGTPKESDLGSKIASSIVAGLGLGDIASYDPDKGEWQVFNSLTKLFNINGKAGTRSLWDVSNHRGAILMSANGLETMALGKEGRGWKPLLNSQNTPLKEILTALGVDPEPVQVDPESYEIV